MQLVAHKPGRMEDSGKANKAFLKAKREAEKKAAKEKEKRLAKEMAETKVRATCLLTWMI